MREYLGYCAIYVNLREAWYLCPGASLPLYCHGASKRRLAAAAPGKQSIYDRLHAVLELVNEQAAGHEAAKHDAAAAVARAICAAFKSVLLHGGALRIFTEADAQLLHEDILALEVCCAHCKQPLCGLEAVMYISSAPLYLFQLEMLGLSDE